MYAWEEWAPSGLDLDLHVQRLDAHGNPLWGTAGTTAVNAAYNQSFPGIVSDGTGGMILVWEDGRNWATSGEDICAMRIDSTGAGVWTVNICTAPENQLRPVVAADGAGGAIIAWADARSGQSHIYARRVTHDGTRMWGDGGIPISTDGPYQDRCTIIADGVGGAWIAWSTPWRFGETIFVQRVDGGGTALFPSNGKAVTDPNSNLPANNYDPLMASDGLGGIFMCWTSDDGAGSWGDLYGQQLGADGSVLSRYSTGFPIVTGKSAYGKVMCSDLRGGAFVAWQDARTGNSQGHLYGQHIGYGGTLDWSAGGDTLTNGAGTDATDSHA